MADLFAYNTSILNFSGNTVTLPATYDQDDDRLIFEIDDDDGVFEGDSGNNEDGNDANQFGTVTDTSGSYIAGGSNVTMYAEFQYNLVAPDGSTITLYAVEIDSNPSSSSGSGILVGYLPSEPLVEGVTYTFTTSNTTPSNDMAYGDIAGAVCFTPGTLIATPIGAQRVEDLRVGDLVITADSGIQAIRWVGKKDISGARLEARPNLRPVKIKKDALGIGLPMQDMWLSQHHRILLSGHAPAITFGSSQMLAPAKGICNDHSIYLDHSIKKTTYYHILFDQHEIVFSNGLPTESFHPGAVGLDAVEEGCRAELFEVFPELKVNPISFGPSVRPSLKIHEARLISDGAQSSGSLRM